MKTVLIFCILLLFSPGGFAKVDLPRGLNAQERGRVLEILGPSSGLRVLGDPYPLGGYSGVEIGVSYETISTTDFSGLGSKPTLQGETSYLQLGFAKGLYYNFDLFVNVAPMGQSEEVSSFGGGFRWGFFEAEYMPISLSLQVGANSTSFQDQVNVTTQSIDLIAGFAVEDITMYVGAGTIKAAGSFLGNKANPSRGMTDTGETIEESLSTSRFLAGLVIKYSKAFFSLEVARSYDPTYGAKIGVRF
ncbi:MAG: hypothetical protein KF681_06465 [Bdellovibrionaceae bacterium]|nr:hypothetical protein [Pseudobdellovibrionaceae bacterium]